MEDTYKKSKGNAGLEGVQFQLDLLIMFLLNALRSLKNWKISTENQEAAKYDDLVLELPDKGVFLQAKFKRTKRISRDQLFSSNSKNLDFSVPKYFFSYLEIKSKVKDKTVIICTNTDIEQNGLENALIHQHVSPDSMLFYKGVTCTYFTFNKNILPELKASVENYFNKNLQGKHIDKSVITDENIDDFLDNLQIFSSYPSGDELHKIIGQLLSGLNDFSFSCRTSHQEIYKKVEDWFKQPKGEYLTELRAKSMFSEIKSDRYCESLKDYNISFKCNDFSFIGSKIFHVVAKDGHLMQMLKIFHVLQDDKNRKLYVNPDEDIETQKHILEAYELHRYAYLIMTWPKVGNETLKKEMCSKLRQILGKYRYKKVILVADANNNAAEQIGVNDIFRVDGSVTFNDLSIDSQEKLNKKNVIFQGQKIRFEQLLQTSENENYRKSLHSEMLELLVKGEEIKVGVKPLDLDEDIARYYVRRRFRSDMRESRKRKHIISEESIYDASEKVILIIDSAGTGKSTVLTKLAVTIKQKNPHLWVIRINLNEYTKILRDYLRKNKKTVSVLDLLNSQDATKLTNDFEKLVFSMNGKVILMMDGVDEISPDYTSLILGTLSQCHQNSNLVKTFVTTRPHISQELKWSLHVGSFKMLPFTRRNQVDFLTSYWSHNLQLDDKLKDKCKRYAETLVTKISTWINSYDNGQSLLAAVPLQVKMLAEIFQENIPWKELVSWEGCKEYLEGNDFKPKLPDKINIVRLYDMFIEKKRDVFLDKGNPIGNMAANQALINQFEECLAYHRSLAIKIILKETEGDFFLKQRESHKYNEECLLKIGVVQKSCQKFQFVHRTFAEYFLADSIVRELQLQNPNLEFQRYFIDEILLKPEYRVVRAFLDTFLHNAVESLPSNIFKNYRSFASKTNLTDNLIFVLSREGWLTLLQLILKSINFKIIKDKEIDIKNWRVKLVFKKRNSLNDLKVLVRNAGLNIKNNIGNTPLHSAIKGCHLQMVKFLTTQGASVNAKNYYNGTALHLAVVKDALDIVEYLVDQGADISVRDNKNLTVLHLAAGYGKLGVVDYLLKRGADINCKEEHNRTPLHLAAERGKIGIVKLLVERGANVNVKHERGCTALDLARERGELETVKYLSEYVEYRNSDDYKLLYFA